MSADITEQHTANGDDLRARYLPVSRKELRRRREAEKLSEEQDAAESESAEQPDDTSDSDPDPDDELARTVQDTAVAEGDDLADEPEADRGEAPDQDGAENGAPTVALPAPPTPVEEPARPEEEIADAEAESEETPVPQQALEAAEDVQPELPEADADSGTVGSRRARRLLRETESIPRLSPELLAELDATNAEIAVIEDPNRVDPELLKKQQALAAKAMQANQERMRKEQAVAEKERRRRSRERPESQVLTEKMLRDSLEEDPDDMQYFTGQIEPMHAQGAHGLDLNKMVDMTARQASRRNVLLWVVIVLAVLLVAAIVAGIYFFLV